MKQDLPVLRIEMGPHVIVAAAKKLPSPEPLKGAPALGDLTFDSVVGQVRTRAEYPTCCRHGWPTPSRRSLARR